MNTRLLTCAATVLFVWALVVAKPALADVDALDPRALYLKQGVFEFEARADLRVQAAQFMGRVKEIIESADF